MGIAIISLAVGFILLLDVQNDRKTISDESNQNHLQPSSDIESASQKTDTANCVGSQLCISEKVTKVVDGDTLYTDSYKIRLSLTNTPEKDESGFAEATDFTKDLCPVGSSILIDQDDKQPVDQYGRIVAKVFCGEKLLNSELLENNHAWLLTQYCSTSEFANEDWAIKFGC